MSELLDIVADDRTEIEIQTEIGGGYKLYVHQGGVTVVRVCKLTPKQVKLGPLGRKSRRGASKC